MFQTHTKLFSGKLGWYPFQTPYLELEDKAKPVHFKSYPIAHAHEEVLLQELQRLCDIGVLSRVGPPDWAFPTFITPKKDGSVRWWISDFVNLPNSSAATYIPYRKSNTSFDDVLDTRNSQQLTFLRNITPSNWQILHGNLCVTAPPYGKIQNKVVPTGIQQFAHKVLEDIFHDLPHQWTFTMAEKMIHMPNG